MEQVINGLVAAAESTAAQASGNDKDDWNHFADALRKLRDQLAAQAPAPTPHSA